MDGKWDVNNDLSVTLSVLGTDNALKHINRSMKVTDGLVGTRGEKPHLKVVGMLVVSLRGVNFGFWSHLGCSGQNAIIFSREGLV